MAAIDDLVYDDYRARKRSYKKRPHFDPYPLEDYVMTSAIITGPTIPNAEQPLGEQDQTDDRFTRETSLSTGSDLTPVSEPKSSTVAIGGPRQAKFHDKIQPALPVTFPLGEIGDHKSVRTTRKQSDMSKKEKTTGKETLDLLGEQNEIARGKTGTYKDKHPKSKLDRRSHSRKPLKRKLWQGSDGDEALPSSKKRRSTTPIPTPKKRKCISGSNDPPAHDHHTPSHIKPTRSRGQARGDRTGA
ncbi:hypothetical protein F5Y15DRAFT_187767 [Xylariaceae sp. FL0016]|nr:hypothetical protein F5Y15DRAFT_187767 [Xylariaceae sp. FL0016]